MKMKKIMKMVLALSLCLGWFLVTSAEDVVKNEVFYSKKFCSELGGEAEYLLPDRTRIDCLTDKVAYEVEYPHKQYETAGQCMHYAYMTGKAPGAAFIVSRKEFFNSDWKYVQRFINYMNYHKIPYVLDLIFKEDY